MLGDHAFFFVGEQPKFWPGAKALKAANPRPRDRLQPERLEL
jgi:hypothetical protein